MMTTHTERFCDAVERGSYTSAASILDEVHELSVDYDWAEAQEQGLSSLRAMGVSVDTSDTEEIYIRRSHDHRSPCERTRDLLEAAGYPKGVDYEALILAEEEEEVEGW
jgi:hypothetical protein